MGTVWRTKNIFTKIGGFSNRNIGEDLEYWVKIALDYPVAISDKITAYYRQNTGGAMKTYGSRKNSNLSSLGDVNAPLAILEQRAKRDIHILENPSIIKYINTILKGDVRSSFYYGNFIMAKQFSKLAIPEKSLSFAFLSVVNIAPVKLTEKAVSLYKKINSTFEK